MSSIKETLVAFRDVLEHSAIFSEEEKQDRNGVYQNIMTVLKTPKNPQKIGEKQRNWKN